jgi:hypothetical protein
VSGLRGAADLSGEGELVLAPAHIAGSLDLPVVLYHVPIRCHLFLRPDTGTHDLAKKVFQAAFMGKPRNRRDDDASHRPEEPRTNRHRQRAAMHAASARNVLHT